VVDAFFAAARRGDFDALVEVLHPDVLLRVDGGDQNREASMLLRGSAAVARQAVMGIRYLLGGPDAGLHRVLVNGSAGVIVTLNGQPITLMSFIVTNGRIVQMGGIADPERLRRIWGPASAAGSG
jgi:SnoaL-like domain